MRLGRILGIEIKISWTLLLFLPLAWWMGILPQVSPLLAIVLYHEFAHAAAAKALGLTVTSIELMPFGGVANIDSAMEADPRKEGIVALAGPASNILVAMGMALYGRYAGGLSEGAARFLEWNLLLAGLNLMPALPLDGGRMLRAALAGSLGLKKATRIAAILGLTLGLMIACIGVWALIQGVYNPTLMLTGLYLVMAAMKQLHGQNLLNMKASLHRQEVMERSGLLPVRHIAAQGTTCISTVMKAFRPMRYHIVTVLDYSGRALGEVSETQIDQGLIQYGPEASMIRLIGK